VKFWRVSDGALLRSLGEQTDDTEALALSPDGTILALGTEKVIKLWRVSDGTRIRTLKTYQTGIEGMAFSPDGTILASGSDDCTIRLWGIP